jgi:hypothetical protein
MDHGLEARTGTMPTDGQEEVIHLRNAVEANLLEAILQSERISHYVKVYRDPGFKGSWSFVDAWGHVECSPADEDRVREILEGIRKSCDRT